MKILHVTKKYPPLVGGDANVAYNLVRQQALLGHEVYIATLRCKEFENKKVLKFGLKERPFNLDRITPRRILSLILLSFWGLKNLGKFKPDIIHSHSADLGFFISIVARIYKIPVINTCHGISFNDMQCSFLKRFAERFFLKYSFFNKITTVNINGQRALKDAGLKNAVYIPIGVDLNRFKKVPKKNTPKTRFLVVGRLEKQKGVLYLIKAAEILKNKKEFEIIIVGEGFEAGYLHEMTLKSDLGEIMNFKGKVDDSMLVEYYHGCDAFILPSLWEGLPLTMLEAAAAGMPIIATNVGGISSLFTHEKSALIIEPKDAEDLANAMLRLIEDIELRGKLGYSARSIAEKFSWENTARAMDEIYMEAANISHT